MTLDERHAKAKADFQALGEQKQRLIQQVNQLDQGLIRADAEMALLEVLMKERDTPAPLELVIPKDEAV